MRSRSVLLLFALLILTSFNSEESYAEPSDTTFLGINLVCGAASDIGCGSRSKPILIDLEAQNKIAEAWLNRPGTIIAVIWEEGETTDINLLLDLIGKHKLKAKILAKEESKIQNQLFKTERWYRTTEVDELSIEEAGRIAENVILAIKDQGSLSDQNTPLMQGEVEAFIKKELLNLQDVNLLSQRSYYKGWETSIKNIAKSYMTDSEVKKIHLFVMPLWIIYGSIAGIILILSMIVYFVYRKRKNTSVSQ